MKFKNIKKQDVVFVILVGVLAYMIFNAKKFKEPISENKKRPLADSPDLEPSSDINVMPNETPTNTNVKKMGFILPDYFRLKKDYVVKFTSPSNPSMTYNAVFKKGQTILGKRYSGDTTTQQFKPFGQGKISTTPDGKMPDFNLVGQVWVEIPESELEEIPQNTGIIHRSNVQVKGIKFKLKEDFSTKNAFFKKGQIINALVPQYTRSVRFMEGGMPYATTIDGSLPKNVDAEGLALQPFIAIPERLLERI